MKKRGSGNSSSRRISSRVAKKDISSVFLFSRSLSLRFSLTIQFFYFFQWRGEDNDDKREISRKWKWETNRKKKKKRMRSGRWNLWMRKREKYGIYIVYTYGKKKSYIIFSPLSLQRIICATSEEKLFSNLTLLAVGRGKTFCIATTNKTHWKECERSRN